MSLARTSVQLMAAFFLMAATGLSAAESLTLSAETGGFSTKLLATSARHVEFEVDVTGKAELGNGKWPAAAIIGLSDGPDRKNSLQLFLVRDRSDAPRVTIGLRLVLEGAEVNSQEIGSLATFGPATMKLSFHEGQITVQVNQDRAILVTTPFTRAVPYVAVNSCTAVFDWKLLGKARGASI